MTLYNYQNHHLITIAVVFLLSPMVDDGYPGRLRGLSRRQELAVVRGNVEKAQTQADPVLAVPSCWRRLGESTEINNGGRAFLTFFLPNVPKSCCQRVRLSWAVG